MNTEDKKFEKNWKICQCVIIFFLASSLLFSILFIIVEIIKIIYPIIIISKKILIQGIILELIGLIGILGIATKNQHKITKYDMVAIIGALIIGAIIIFNLLPIINKITPQIATNIAQNCK